MVRNELKRYGFVFGLLMILLFYIYSSFGHVEYRLRQNNDFTVIKEVWEGKSGKGSPKEENKTIVEFALPEVQNGRSELAFSTIHQSVAVFLNDTMVYRLTPDPRNAFGKTTGVTWHMIPILEEDRLSKVRVEMWTPYESAVGIVPTFYFGEKYDIVMDVISKDVLPMALSFITLIIGVGFVCYVLIVYKDREVNKDLMHLGFFAICISTWQITDLPAAKMIYYNNIVISYIPFVALMLIPIPFSMFVGGLHGGKKHKAWRSIEILSYVNIAICVGLQLLNIADFRETLWVTHVTFIVGIAIGVYMVLWEIKKYGLSPKRKVNIICLMICFACTFIDLARYYFSQGTVSMYLGALGFLIYVASLGYTTIRETRKLLDALSEAQKFEKLAYHDQMTGCLNRLAWAEMIRGVDVEKDSGVVIMFDLNDLKLINDTKGHEYGDKYITESASIIKDILGGSGSVFRVGGDEFCVLLHATKLREADAFLARLDEAFAKYNKAHPDMMISIAYGSARFDKLTDVDLNDTRSRADSEMYHNKFKMKEKNE